MKKAGSFEPAFVVMNISYVRAAVYFAALNLPFSQGSP